MHHSLRKSFVRIIARTERHIRRTLTSTYQPRIHCSLKEKNCSKPHRYPPLVRIDSLDTKEHHEAYDLNSHSNSAALVLHKTCTPNVHEQLSSISRFLCSPLKHKMFVSGHGGSTSDYIPPWSRSETNKLRKDCLDLSTTMNRN